jgi:3-oxoadipate enol-lactonase
MRLLSRTVGIAINLIIYHVIPFGTSAEKRQHFLKLRRDPLLANMDLADIAPGIVQSLSGPYATEHSRKSLMDSLPRLHKESHLKSLQATVNFDVRHAIAQIVCPTLVVVGEFDALTPLSEAQAICAEIRNSHLVVIAGAGHLSN